jgi:hypothetical protein
MPNSFDLDDDDEFDYDDEPGSTPNRGLRDHAKNLEKQLKALRKENATLKTGQRETNIESLIKAKGLNPLLAGIVPEAVTDKAALTTWFDTYGVLFSATQEPPAPDAGDGPGVAPTNVDPAVLLELQNQSDSEAGGTSTDSGAIEALLANAKSQDEIKQILLDNGAMRL